MSLNAHCRTECPPPVRANGVIELLTHTPQNACACAHARMHPSSAEPPEASTGGDTSAAGRSTLHIDQVRLTEDLRHTIERAKAQQVRTVGGGGAPPQVARERSSSLVQARA